MTTTDTARPSGTRAHLRTISQWLDSYTLWSMNSAQTLAAREQLLVRQWDRATDQRTRSTDEDAVAREMAR